MQPQEQDLTVGLHKCLKLQSFAQFNQKDDLWTNGTRSVSGNGPCSFGIHEPLSCVLIGQSAPLWISNHPSYVCGSAVSLLGYQINYLKMT